MARPDLPHEEIDLEEPAPRPAVYYAEQALLGALVLEPNRLQTLTALTPDHFGDPAHSALFAAMRQVPAPVAEVHRREPAWLNAVLVAARGEAAGLTASYLHTLVDACPWPQHAAAYARMVRADHARRSLRMHAERLAQATTDTTGPNPTVTVLAEADTLTRFLDDLAGRFPPHPGSLPRTLLPSLAPRGRSEEALSEEQLLLAAATTRPDELKTMRWLQGDDFALPLHGALFRALTALAHRGDPVDPVTVLWEAQHHGLLTADLTPTALITLVTNPVGSPEHWGERVLQRSLLDHARLAALRIQAFADDPANSPHQLVTGSRRALAELTAVRARWQRATTPPAPARRPHTPRAPAVARAGPPRISGLPASAAQRLTR
ncbi:DnaB-like helicase N-terminal domain-containing protein [Streptomyces sp. NPDC021100]|uniref:DnaB-like helicase N-terminal domain-containing protein n=1 Tax=Streptomyces sp. NPDC021100 TaxID=3365114 RepID=UPI0037AD5C0E